MSGCTRTKLTDILAGTMATLKELRDERLRKLDELRQLGVNPYPAEARRTHDVS